MKDSTRRFSDRVDNYIKYRPSYPMDVSNLLKEQCSLTERTVIADIGSGTGIFTKLLLENGNQVYAIEPNDEMRQAAERLLKAFPGFVSINAPAEATSLESDLVDIITSAQAFHWFDIEKAKAEFNRILHSGGWVVLIWNERKTDSSEFLAAYESFLHKYATDYSLVNHVNVDNEIFAEFFSSGTFKTAAFENSQHFDYEGLKGRLLSCSYAPDSDRPEYESMLCELENMFHTYADNGRIIFEYQTMVYYGQLTAQ